MISRFFTFRQLRRCLCFVLAFLTLAFALSPSLFQPAEAVAVADDITLALALLFTSWAGITFPTNAGAQNAVSNLISSKPAVATSIAGLITKNLVIEGSKLLLTGDIRTAFRDILPEIRDFFQVSSETNTGSFSFTDDSVLISSSSISLYDQVFSVSADGPIYYFLYTAWVSSGRNPVYHPAVCFYTTGSSLLVSCSNNSFNYYTSPNGIHWCYNTSNLASLDTNPSFPVLGINSVCVKNINNLLADISLIEYQQSKEIDGTSALEILAPAPDYVPNPDDSQEPTNPDGSIFSGLSLSALLALIQQFATNPDADPGLDPDKMMQELQEAMGNTDPEPEPDPDPDPDPNPEPEPDAGELGKPHSADWKNVFPFCIPFDLIDFLGILAAEPEAPVIRWRFYVPKIVDQEIVIDLSPWDSVAQIVRTMELLAFCVGLILLTRNIIRG